MMANVNLLTPKILKWEGGLSNNKLDLASKTPCPTPYKGGYGYHTNKGITYAVWVSYFGKDKDIRFLEMNNEDWTVIMKSLFWDRWKADYIDSQNIANICADWVWASGKYGITLVQKVLGVTQDGIVGNQTLKAMNSQCAQQLHAKIWNRRKLYYDRLVANNQSQNVFYKGWINRLNDFKWADLL